MGMEENESKIQSTEKQQKNKKKAAAIVLLLVIIAIAVFWFIKTSDSPLLYLEKPPEVTAQSDEKFLIDAVLSDMGDVLYPAASMVIEFDKNRLEFTGIEMGNMMVYDDFVPEEDQGEPVYTTPDWDCNPEVANQTGEIRAMYLDMTGGRYAYGSGGFDQKSQNVVLRLGFRMRGSSSSGDKLDITIKEGVFAASGGDVDKTSLSNAADMKTLRVKGTSVKVK